MKVIKTTSSVKDVDSLYSLIRSVALYYKAILEDDDAVARELVSACIKATVSAKAILGKDGVGMPAGVANDFVKQLKMWADNRINWDNDLHSRRFDNVAEEYLLYLYTIILESPEDELNPRQLELVKHFDDSEFILLRCMIGYALNMGSKYGRAITIENTLRANAQMFPEDRAYYTNYIDTLEEDGYEIPSDYELQTKKVRNILEQNGITTIAGDDLLPTFHGDAELAKKNPEQYKQYLECRKYLRYQAFRAIVANLVYDNAGTPTPWNTVYRQVTTREGVYIPHDIFPNSAWTGIVEAQRTQTSASYGIVHRSPFGEEMKQIPVGNVEMNAKYTKGSTEFVCRYVKPTSREQSMVYAYTVSGNKVKSLDRFDQMRKILENVDKYRGVWMKDLKKLSTALDKYGDQLIKNAMSKSTRKKTPPKAPTPIIWRQGILAMLCEIGYQAAPRTGEDGTSSLEKGTGKRITTYALSTLKMAHLKTNPVGAHPVERAVSEEALTMANAGATTVTFMYRGKAAEPQQHTFTDTPSDGDTTSRKILMTALRGYISVLASAYKDDVEEHGHTREDLMRTALFRIPNKRIGDNLDVDSWINVINKTINSYLKNTVKFPSTFKQFRKLKATKVFMDYMDSVKAELTVDNIESHVRYGAGMSGDALGHAAGKSKAHGTMALQYYIDAMTILKYYKEVGADPSKGIANLIKDNIQDAK